MKVTARRIQLVAASLVLSACTTLQPVEMPAPELQSLILSGDLSLVGESVKVVTVDGKSRRYRVTDVDTEQRLLRGNDVTVRIDEIVAIETSEFSLGKTALLASGSYVVLALIAIAVGPAFLL